MVARSTCAGAAATAFLIGCQTFAPHPLDLAGYQRDWEARELGSGAAAALVEPAGRGAKPRPRGADDALTLADSEPVALLLNPRLRALRQRAEVSRAGAGASGRWQDPELALDALRIPSSVRRPWVLAAELRLTLPISGGPGAERRLAWAEHGAAWRAAALAEWELLGELRQRWLAWSATERWVELLEEYLARLEPVERRAAQLADAGELPPVDARPLQIELIRRRVQLEGQRAGAARERRELLALLGLAPDAPVVLAPSSMDAPERAPPVDERALALREHPEVLAAEAGYAVAERSLEGELRRRRPDVTLRPLAQWEDGRARLGLGAGLPLPLWDRNARGVAEAEAARAAARAESEAVVQRLTHRLVALEDAWRAARRARRSLEREVAPLVHEQLREAERLVALGELGPLRWQYALAGWLETQQALLEAALEEAQASAALRAVLDPHGATRPAGEEDQ